MVLSSHFLFCNMGIMAYIWSRCEKYRIGYVWGPQLCAWHLGNTPYKWEQFSFQPHILGSRIDSKILGGMDQQVFWRHSIQHLEIFLWSFLWPQMFTAYFSETDNVTASQRTLWEQQHLWVHFKGKNESWEWHKWANSENLYISMAKERDSC